MKPLTNEAPEAWNATVSALSFLPSPIRWERASVRGWNPAVSAFSFCSSLPGSIASLSHPASPYGGAGEGQGEGSFCSSLPDSLAPFLPSA